VSLGSKQLVCHYFQWGATLLEAREWRFCFYEGEFQSFETVPAQICFGNIMLCIMIPLSDGPSNLSLKAALQLFHIKQLIFNINTRCTK
jgi:hypothetical protein